jgi:hypothetical protein
MAATRSMHAASATLDPPNLCTRHRDSAISNYFLMAYSHRQAESLQPIVA